MVAHRLHQPDRPGRSVVCPKCDAPVGRPCLTPAGNQHGSSHNARLQAEADQKDT